MSKELVGYGKQYSYSPLSAQMKRLVELFPTLALDLLHSKKPHVKLPDGAEGWFAIPRWTLFSMRYSSAADQVYWHYLRHERCIHGDSIRASTRYSDEDFTCRRLRQTERTYVMWQKLCSRQKNSKILFVPAQFGLRHAGCSAEQAEREFAENEFGLDMFATAIMLLTNPTRVPPFWEEKNHPQLLNLLCLGDEYDLPTDKHRFNRIPEYGFQYENPFFWLDLKEKNEITNFLGPVTAFLY